MQVAASVRSPRLRAAALFLAGAAAFLGGSGAGAAPRFPVAVAGELDLPAEEKTLGNGMKLIVLEDHSVPNCALYVWWRVGSRNERTGTTGVAHFFEHMMFMGGAKYGTKFDPVMEAAGGSNNAYTSFDVTVYQDWFPASALPLVLDMEKDRMSGMVFHPVAVAQEREVVYSEYRNSAENPSERLDWQLRAAAYTTHPYQWDVIGWEADIRGWKQEDLERFYTEHYAPNHATVVLVGDVKAADAFRLMEDAFGGIPRKPERRPVHSKEPPQTGERRVVLEAPDATLPEFSAAWHIPATGDPEFPVFEVIEDLLLDGRASRLQKALVEDELVCFQVGGGWMGHQFDPSLFTVNCVLPETGSTADVEKRVYAALEALAKDGPTERELRRVKNKNRAELVHRMETIDGKAALLGETETFFGGWRNVGRRMERIEAVTAEDVKRVVAKTFTRSNRTVATLTAPSSPSEESAPAPKSSEEKR